MSTINKTPNLHLPQYTPEDVFDMVEINEAYSTIDATYIEMKENKDEVVALAEGFDKAEALRVSSENNRANAENSRVNAESTRATAESNRAKAEQNRVNSFNNIVTANETFKTDITNKIDTFVDKVNVDIYDSKIDFFGKEHDKLNTRLNADFDNVHQRINESELLPYEGTSIKADNSYYGLQKDTIIKGRTLQNIVKSYNSSEFLISYPATLSESVFKIPEGESINHMYVKARASNHLYKPNTTYTVFVDILENTTGKKLGISNIHSMISDKFERDFQNLTGVSCVKFTTSTDGLSPQGGAPSLGIYFGIWDANDTSGEFSKYIKFKYWILEGDHTQTPLEELPFIDGIESVGESELTDEGYKISGKSTGKNLFNLDMANFTHNLLVDKKNLTVQATNNNYNEAQLWVHLQKGVSYRISIEGHISDTANYQILEGMQKGFKEDKLLNITLRKDGFTFTHEDGWYSIHLVNIRESSNYLLYAETGDSSYEPYKESNYSYILNEPLRSLPNGVSDEIDLEIGVLTRRVGKVVVDGSENWYAWTNIQTIQDTHVAFTLGHDFIGTNYKDSKENNLLCNNFMVSDNPTTINNSKPYRLCALNNHELYALQFKIEKTALVSSDCDGFKQWLQDNPTTVYYQLSEPTTEQLTPQQLKSFDTTTHIISDNKLMPIVSTKIPSNVQAIISTLKLENSDLKNNVEVLTAENEELKSVNNVQDEMIDINMLATDEVYSLIEPLLLDMLSERGVSKLVDMYVAMVQRGLKTLDEVPARYREQVISMIQDN